jgi:protein O-GlcNAc transferase
VAAVVRNRIGERVVTIGRQPSPDAIVEQAIALRVAGKSPEALELVERSLATFPGHAMLHHMRAGLLMELHRMSEALAPARHAAELDPADSGFQVLVGMILGGMGSVAEATAAYRAALRLDPASGAALQGLVEALRVQNDTAGADAAFTAHFAAQKRPSPTAICSAAEFLLATARGDQAARLLRNGISLYPNETRILSVLPGSLNYVDVVPAGEVIRAHAECGKRFAGAIGLERMLLTNKRASAKRLKVGYVSPDFRGHSVAYFLEPLLESHDRSGFEIYGYATFLPGNGADSHTARLAAKCDHFHESPDLAGHALADQIASDGIDVLVDLAGWTGGSRPVTMLKKPAPVLVGYLGYPNIMGFPTVDARLVDELTDPVANDGFDQLGEPLMRLGRPLWCFRPPADAPDVGALPLTRNGYVTFGSFNALKKISLTTGKLWAAAMNAVPGSRLVIKAYGLGDPFVVKQYSQLLTRAGVDLSRVAFRIADGTTATHLSRYADIDIALDTWPYNGTTTTCESLWMGVPVVSMTGRGHWSRVGLSLLSAMGLGELACATIDDVAKTAGTLATDVPRLTELRATLRDRMIRSPLMDARSLCAALERAYRELWTAWCQGTMR